MYAYVYVYVCVHLFVYVYMHMYIGWRRCIGCFIFIGHFPQNCPIIDGSFAERDLQLQASYGSSTPCMCKCLTMRTSTFYSVQRAFVNAMLFCICTYAKEHCIYTCTQTFCVRKRVCIQVECVYACTYTYTYKHIHESMCM